MGLPFFLGLRDVVESGEVNCVLSKQPYESYIADMHLRVSIRILFLSVVSQYKRFHGLSMSASAYYLRFDWQVFINTGW